MEVADESPQRELRTFNSSEKLLYNNLARDMMPQLSKLKYMEHSTLLFSPIKQINKYTYQ